MKNIIVLAIVILIGCKEEQKYNGVSNNLTLDIKKQDNYIIRGQTFEHSLKYKGDLYHFDSIIIEPDSLIFNHDTSFIKIKPDNNYLIGSYPYNICFYSNSKKYTYQDKFEVIENYIIISNLKMNFLILGEKNPINISGGYYSIHNCRITSKDSVEIERYDDFHYTVTPKQKGKILLKLEAIMDGEFRSAGLMEFQVITGDEKINELIK